MQPWQRQIMMSLLAGIDDLSYVFIFLVSLHAYVALSLSQLIIHHYFQLGSKTSRGNLGQYGSPLDGTQGRDLRDTV
jgi:hypothetical protein